MQRTFVAALASLALLFLAGQAQAQQQIKTMEITIKSGDEEFKAFVAMPEGKGPFPGVVVIQEWWGLNDWIKENAQHFAKKGFVAIAPDLYHGKVATDPGEASQFSSATRQHSVHRSGTSACFGRSASLLGNSTKWRYAAVRFGSRFSIRRSCRIFKLARCTSPTETTS